MKKAKNRSRTQTTNPAAALYMSVIVSGALIGALGGTDFLHGVAIGIIIAGAIAMGWSIAAQA